MTRTIVVSDIHGEPAVLERAVEHARFDPRCDRLLVAGDCVEVGTDPKGAVEAVDRLAADVLVGNHELALILGQPIEMDTRPDERLRELLSERVVSGAWPLAAEVDGVLVSHAGFSRAHERTFEAEAGSDPARFVRILNRRWVRDLRSALERGSIAFGDLTGMTGPLWFRPAGPGDLLAGVVQVAGHTPPEVLRDPKAAVRLRRAGFHIVDPYVRGWIREGRPEPPPFRYAIVEAGSVRVRGSVRRGAAGGRR